MTGLYNFISIFLFLGGLAILVAWAYNGGFGLLERRSAKRNYIPLYLPAVLIFGWLFSIFSIVSVVEKVKGGDVGNVGVMVVTAVVEFVFIFMMLGAGRRYFVRGLRGLGFRWGNVLRDLWVAAVCYAAILPVIGAAVILTMKTGQLFDPDFQLQPHQGLTELEHLKSVEGRLVLVVLFVFIAPVFEEVLFRGYLQSLVSSYVGSAWVSIVVVSALFAVLHDMSHWPALFFLSLGLGWSYRQSGSLLRPIFLHIIFNGVSVAAVLLGGLGS
jgi:membrane protease YdiL (CAAX protease family)